MSNSRRWISAIAGLCLSLGAATAGAEPELAATATGPVPDEAAAIRIAEAAWQPLYGEALENERPFQAILKNGVWHVSGFVPAGSVGATAEAEIRQADGRILRLSHGQ